MKVEETWRDIVDYEGYYQVSNYGRIRSVDRWVKHTHWKTRQETLMLRKGHTMKPGTSPNGYKIITLQKQGRIKYCTVHRVVALHFITNIHNCPQINHKDLNKENNCYTNLEWCTSSENMKHAALNGRISGHNQYTHGKV